MWPVPRGTPMTESLRLKRLSFLAGPKPEAPPLDVDLQTILVLVGPNNSGKSLALREIEQWCVAQEPARKVVGDLAAVLPEDPEEGLALVRIFRTPPPQGQIDP